MAERFKVSKTSTCNNCGSSSVYWVKSNRSGKYYLIEVDSFGFTDRTDFHSKYCGLDKTSSAPTSPATITAGTPTINGNTVSFPEDAPLTISGNGKSVVSALNALLAKTPDAPPATKPAPAQTAKTSPWADYVCVNVNCAKNDLMQMLRFTPGKPTMCPTCSRVLKFVQIRKDTL